MSFFSTKLFNYIPLRLVISYFHETICQNCYKIIYNITLFGNTSTVKSTREKLDKYYSCGNRHFFLSAVQIIHYN